MATYYLDSSALLKRYRTEPGTEVVRELIGNSSPDDVFITSLLTTLEIEASVVRILKGRVITEDAYHVLLGRLTQDVRDVLALYPVTSVTIQRAVEITRRHGLRAGDAIHLATALQSLSWRGELLATQDRAIVLVTSDRELLTAASRERQLIALDPQAVDAMEQVRLLRQ